MSDNSKKQRRSVEWFGRQDSDGFIYRSWMKNRACRTTSSTAAR